MRKRRKSAYDRRQEAIRAKRRALGRRIHRAERAVDAISQELLNDRERAEPIYQTHSGGANRKVMDSIGAALRSLANARSWS